MTADLSTKLGQLFFVGLEGYTLTDKTKRILKEIKPGGIIVYECNVKEKEQLKNLIKDIKDILPICPFIAVDQEGGSVERLRKVCTPLPSSWGLSKTGIKELLTANKIISEEISELGFNMNFAPVLDINSNPKNPVIGSRSISDNPKVVADYGSQIVKLFLTNKIIPVAKHFPGHGDLSIDSHLSLPVLNKTLSEIHSFELIPFIKAIKIGLPAIMVGHILLPKIEKENNMPASISNSIIKSLLRKNLSFKGLIITDELSMKAISKNRSLNKATYKAIESGADMALFDWSITSSFNAFKYLLKKSKEDYSLQKRINESYKRIIKTKIKFHISKRSNSKRTNDLKNKRISVYLANKVVHWIKKDLFITQKINKSHSLEIIFPVTPKLQTEDLKRICKELKISHPSFINYNLNPSNKEIQSIKRKLKKSKWKVLITYDMSARTGQLILLRNLLQIFPDLVTISVGLPYEIVAFPNIKNLIASYAPNYISLRASFEKLLY